MALRSILKREDPVLQKKSHAVVKFDQKLWDLLDDLQETLAEANGLGLAAPQVGILRRVAIVIDAQGEVIELINPTILETQGEDEGLEGCLSIPGLWGYVSRPTKVTVQSQDRQGNTFEITGEDLVARCFCHEIEHLDGILYTNHCDEIYSAEQLAEMEAEES